MCRSLYSPEIKLGLPLLPSRPKVRTFIIFATLQNFRLKLVIIVGFVRTIKGKKVVADRELTITYIYNAYYWTINIIGFLADFTPLLERYVGFWVAYLVPCCAMWLALLPVLFERNYFIRVVPTMKIMPQVCTALRLGITGGFKMDAAKPDVQLQLHDCQVPWTDLSIEDIKLSLLTSRVLILFPIHWLCYNQTFNNLISQAGQMKTYGIPNDMIKITGAPAKDRTIPNHVSVLIN
ncbi:POT family-domain-containing protein [Penicillium sp. IBT 35674x]|nr:POT family-domain-containing protein [Penicillium sp. IBT 35674x]